MKPCEKCIEEYGRHLCTHHGCCVFEGVYGDALNIEYDNHGQIVLQPGAEDRD